MSKTFGGFVPDSSSRLMSQTLQACWGPKHYASTQTQAQLYCILNTATRGVI